MATRNYILKENNKIEKIASVIELLIIGLNSLFRLTLQLRV